MAELAVETVRLPLGAPVATAWGTLTGRELVRVRLRFGPGDAGDGEAALLEPYDGVPLAATQRRLLLSPADTPVAHLKVREVIAIPGPATVLDACEFFTLHKLLAFPVVDE